MDSFQNLTRMDRRKFLASLIAIGASAGVLGKLGMDQLPHIVERLPACSDSAEYLLSDGSVERISGCELLVTGWNPNDLEVMHKPVMWKWYRKQRLV